MRAAHGLKGEVSVRTFDPASETLYEVDRVLAKKRDGTEVELTLEAVREAPKGDLLVAFESVVRREEAEGLVGSTLLAFREDLDEPAEGEVFQGDLIGLSAFDPEGRALGTVEEIWNSGPVPNLVIRGGGKELMVPFIDEFVPQVDLEGRRVVVRPLELDE
ncbi:MAG: 16S rRNA processing protein RimM [Archangiaceae bacterium]|nr:16S rRNA processing protein RimM [Archangiaceae bacterium]